MQPKRKYDHSLRFYQDSLGTLNNSKYNILAFSFQCKEKK